MKDEISVDGHNDLELSKKRPSSCQIFGKILNYQSAYQTTFRKKVST